MKSVVPASPARSRVDWLPHLHQTFWKSGIEAQYNENKMKSWLESSPLTVLAGFLLLLKTEGHGLKDKGFIQVHGSSGFSPWPVAHYYRPKV